MRVRAAVDVARGYFRGLNVRVLQFYYISIVGAGADAGEAPALIGIQDEYLATLFSVHLKKTGHHFHNAVKFGCNHVLIGTDPHVNGLTAAFERQKQFSRLQIALDSNGVGALKIFSG